MLGDARARGRERATGKRLAKGHISMRYREGSRAACVCVSVCVSVWKRRVQSMITEQGVWIRFSNVTSRAGGGEEATHACAIGRSTKIERNKKEGNQ